MNTTRQFITFAAMALAFLAPLGAVSPAQAADPLDTWTARTMPVPVRPLLGAAWGSGTFVAVGDNGAIITSPDGEIWTARDSGTTLSLAGVAWGNGTFVAVGGDPATNTGIVLTSPTGETWTSHAPGVAHSLSGVAWGNGTFVAVGQGGAILTSPTGESWTSRTSGTTNEQLGVAWGVGKFVAVGNDAATCGGRIYTSTTGESWTSPFSWSGNPLMGVACSAAACVAVGSNIFSTSGTALYSTTGSSWTATYAGPDSLYGVAWGNGYFTAVGGSSAGAPRIYTSTDGQTWTPRTVTGTIPLWGAGYGNGSFVAVGNSGTILQSGDTLIPLHVNKSGNGSGSVTTPDDAINCGATCSATFPWNSTVELTATPDPSSTFGGWSGDCSGSGTCSVTMSAPRDVTAAFTLKSFTITLSPGPIGTIYGPTSANYGESPHYTISPDPWYRIVSVSGCGGTWTGRNPYITGPITGPCTISATFTPLKSALTVTLAGAGYGSVESTPVGILCPGGNCTASFDYSTSVSLKQSAVPGSLFAGWSNACSGLGPCSVTMDTARAVTATFELGPNVLISGTTQTFGRIQDAYAIAGDGALLKSQGITFRENLNLGSAKSVTIRGGYDSTFTTRSGMSTVMGTLTVARGSVVIDGIMVR